MRRLPCLHPFVKDRRCTACGSLVAIFPADPYREVGMSQLERGGRLLLAATDAEARVIAEHLDWQLRAHVDHVGVTLELSREGHQVVRCSECRS